MLSHFPPFAATAVVSLRSNRWRRNVCAVPTHRSTALKPTTILRICPRDLHRPWAFFKGMGLLGLGLVLTVCQAVPQPKVEATLERVETLKSGASHA